MKTLYLLLVAALSWFPVSARLGHNHRCLTNTTTIDIDKLDYDHYKIMVDGMIFQCTARRPVSHSWTYECTS